MQTEWPTAQAVLPAIGKVNAVDEVEVEKCLAAAIDWVTARSVSFEVDAGLEIPDAVYRAVTMLAARLFKRRESPEGVAGFGDMGAVRVMTVDPDIENLLAPSREWGIA